MKKYYYIFILVFCSSLIYSQKDSTIRKNFNHFAGIDIGYTSYDKIIGFKGETNINYVFNPHYFCAKIQLGVAPGTNFGNLKKALSVLDLAPKQINSYPGIFLQE